MPTTATKPKAKATRKPAARKAAARKPAAKAAGAKASRTRAVHTSEAAAKQSANATVDTAQAVGDYAERAILIPVGAALIARDRVISTVSGTIDTYSSSAKTQKQLRRFERRAVTARKRLEREVRKARVRFERDLRQRRRVIESTVGDIEERRDLFVRNSNEIADRVPELAGRVQERILSLV